MQTMNSTYRSKVWIAIMVSVIVAVALIWQGNDKVALAQQSTPIPVAAAIALGTATPTPAAGQVIPPLLASGVPATTGQQVSFSGWLTLMWGDGKAGSNEAYGPIPILTDNQGRQIELELSEQLTRSLGGILTFDRQRVSVQGVRAQIPSQGASIGTLRVQSIRLESGTKAPAASGVSGSQPWVSIMCKFADVTAEPKDLAYFQGMYSSTYPGLDHYWREVSYNNINVVGSAAVGWYTLPHPKSYYVYDQNGDGQVELDFGRAANDCTAVADADVYFPNYVGINLMFNDNLDCCAWGGSWYLNRDGVSKAWYATWEPPWGYGNVTVMSHEMGHGFGLPHSAHLNSWDIMSEGWRYCYLSTDPVYGCVAQHTISYHIDRLGWISAGQKYMATSGSQSTITLEQLALPQTSNYRMVQIPISGSATHFYTVEARRKVGYDVKLPGEAVIIHEVDTTWGIPAQVINKDKNSDPGATGAMWLPGDTFSDSWNGITVCINSATATGFVVTVAVGIVPTCSFVTYTPTPTATPAPGNVTAKAVWTTDENGNSKSTFNPGDKIHYVGDVYNTNSPYAVSHENRCKLNA